MKRTIAGFVLLTLLVMSGLQGCLMDDGDVQPGDARAKFLGEWKVNEDCKDEDQDNWYQ